MRILSGDFKKDYNFSINYNQTKNKELYEKKLNFSVIGTDSAMRRYPVHDVDKLHLAPAERADILINFTDVGSDYVKIIL